MKPPGMEVEETKQPNRRKNMERRDIVSYLQDTYQTDALEIFDFMAYVEECRGGNAWSVFNLQKLEKAFEAFCETQVEAE